MDLWVLVFHTFTRRYFMYYNNQITIHDIIVHYSTLLNSTLWNLVYYNHIVL